MALAHVPRRWWRRSPLPDPAWLRFRMETAYGDASAVPPGEDLLALLRWSRRMRAVTGRRLGERRSVR